MKSGRRDGAGFGNVHAAVSTLDHALVEKLLFLHLVAGVAGARATEAADQEDHGEDDEDDEDDSAHEAPFRGPGKAIGSARPK